MPPSEQQALFLAFAEEIDTFYRGRLGLKRSCAFPWYPTIDIHRAAARLYLRFRPGGFWPEDAIVIASIGFRKKRKGEGTALLNKLVELSGHFGLNSIGIEQTGGDESIQNFVRKFGFAPYQDDRNWLVQVETLRVKLAALATSPV